MNVEIFSMNAALAGWSSGTTWRGNVDDSYFLGCTTVDQTLERLWRLFNVVEHDDRPRLLSWGYKLPSLSVGDYVTVPNPGEEDATVTFQAASVGFRPVSHEDLLRGF